MYLKEAVNIVDAAIAFMGEDVLPEYRARAIEVVWNAKDHGHVLISRCADILADGTIRFLCDDPHDEHRYYLSSMY